MLKNKTQRSPQWSPESKSSLFHTLVRLLEDNEEGSLPSAHTPTLSVVRKEAQTGENECCSAALQKKI